MDLAFLWGEQIIKEKKYTIVQVVISAMVKKNKAGKDLGVLAGVWAGGLQF